MIMSNKTCPRLSSAAENVRNHQNTKKMLDKNMEFLEDKIIKQLREKTGLAISNGRELSSIVNYIDWALRSHITLNFTLTEEEMGFIEMGVEAPVYQDFAAYPE